MKYTSLICSVVCLCLVAGCGRGNKQKESLTKRAAKKITNTAFDAVDGVTEVVAERGKKTAETTSKAAGEVLAGATEGGKDSMDEHGTAIGSNLVSTAAPVLTGAAAEAETRIEAAAADKVKLAGPLGSDTNPVRCQMPAGERAYLSRLRTADGAALRYRRVGSFAAGPYGNVLDGYEVTGGEKTAMIYMDMYHVDYVETNAVPGFTIIND